MYVYAYSSSDIASVLSYSVELLSVVEFLNKVTFSVVFVGMKYVWFKLASMSISN